MKRFKTLCTEACQKLHAQAVTADVPQVTGPAKLGVMSAALLLASAGAHAADAKTSSDSLLALFKLLGVLFQVGFGVAGLALTGSSILKWKNSERNNATGGEIGKGIVVGVLLMSLVPVIQIGSNAFFGTDESANSVQSIGL